MVSNSTKQANNKPMNSMSVKQALQITKLPNLNKKKVKYFERQINKPFDSAGDCQWRNKALK